MPGRLYNIYCDESRQCADRFMILGGIIIPAAAINTFNQTMAAYRQMTGMHAELKWSKVTNQKYKEYQTFVDHFFALVNTNTIHFKAMMLDTHHLDHRRFSRGDYEVGFYKFYYQLLLHKFGKVYCTHKKPCRFIVHLDERKSSYQLSELKTILNNGMARNFKIADRPFHSIEPIDSKQSEVLQICDIILGAIGFQKNGYHLLAGTRKAKKDLANYIAASVGKNDLAKSYSWGADRFEVWNFKLRQRE